MKNKLMVMSGWALLMVTLSLFSVTVSKEVNSATVQLCPGLLNGQILSTKTQEFKLGIWNCTTRSHIKSG